MVKETPFELCLRELELRQSSAAALVTPETQSCDVQGRPLLRLDGTVINHQSSSQPPNYNIMRDPLFCSFLKLEPLSVGRDTSKSQIASFYVNTATRKTPSIVACQANDRRPGDPRRDMIGISQKNKGF